MSNQLKSSMEAALQCSDWAGRQKIFEGERKSTLASWCDWRGRSEKSAAVIDGRQMLHVLSLERRSVLDPRVHPAGTSVQSFVSPSDSPGARRLEPRLTERCPSLRPVRRTGNPSITYRCTTSLPRTALPLSLFSPSLSTSHTHPLSLSCMP